MIFSDQEWIAWAIFVQTTIWLGPIALVYLTYVTVKWLRQ